MECVPPMGYSNLALLLSARRFGARNTRRAPRKVRDAVRSQFGPPLRKDDGAPLVALVIGAAAATGTYALIDNGDDAIEASTRLIVVETPAQHSADIPGKNEAATAVAITPTLSVAGPDEASTAAAVSQSSVTKPRGSKAATAGPEEASTAAAVSQSSGTEPLGSALP